jgi:hypothetical protein
MDGGQLMNTYISFIYLLSSLSETLARSIGLKETDQIPQERFEKIDKLHFEVENKLIGLIKSLEQKKGKGDWIDRISEDL